MYTCTTHMYMYLDSARLVKAENLDSPNFQPQRVSLRLICTTHRIFLGCGRELGLPPILGPLPHISYDIFQTKPVLFGKFCHLKNTNVRFHYTVRGINLLIYSQNSEFTFTLKQILYIHLYMYMYTQKINS